ncbi:hypothetical protein AVEN_116292-1 [Araneus ventricosus]|uniref:Tc1-like transposase DDE domain-containing protein n=1 Tax=Araneus ventricosus TaxID=182803 RepID=A0A4Y2WV11_ARAVE|nr:hypothetical protein AVEN_12069-1 [Araneus ventricosus]GBO40084.1 hypothetical protein AVEN_30715-1 [Araneus ventricosus]GBO40087.1 hypothetical protein AVEN_180204-1 [Araneus ventricosus]GBO40300.1 hypothetical protein AVEN_116292-1 [Araneus ventricosus]
MTNESLLHNHLIPALQHRACVGSTIFTQDAAPSNIANPFKRLLSVHFGNDVIISRHVPTNWSPRSPDLNPYDFSLWGYLKHDVSSGPIVNLAELKASTARHIHTISSDTLRFVVEHAISRFKLVA